MARNVARENAGGLSRTTLFTQGMPRNITATSNPTVNDDVNSGYNVGSIWINVSTDAIYFCGDSSDGAAVWALTASAAVTEITSLAKTDSNFIVGNGSAWVAESGATVRASLGVTIGTHVQAYDADLAALAGLTSAANKVPMFSGSGSASLLDFLDEDNMASNSATAVASQQSLKAYVDSQVDTVNSLAEILALGNSSGGTGLVITAGDAFTVNTITETTGGSGVTIDSVLLKDNVVTATTFIGNVTGNASGTAATVTTAAQSNITSLGTLTTLTVDNVIVNGTTIGHTSDTDLLTLTSANLAVAGDLEVSGSVEVATIDYTDGDNAITIADGGGITLGSTLTATASLQIRTIDYSDGDLAITIADGGGITAAAGITSTAAANTLGATSFNDASITNVNDIALDSISADGTDINVAVSDNSATALTIKQGSDAYLIIDTANSSESVSIGTGISGTAITLGHSTSEVTVADNLTVTGDLVVNGDTVTVSTATLSVEDPLIALATGNGADSVDVGLYAKYTDSGVKYSGLFRDASDSDKWKLFATTGNSHAAPTTTIDTTSGFTLGTLVANVFEGGVTGDVTGDVTGNADTATALATTRAINGVNFDGSAAITVTAAAGTLSGDTLKSTVVTSSLTAVGTIATGVWAATDVGVTHGGTGASSLTDGGILVGSGTGAITAMAVLADGEMIVGDGTTDPVAESGSTLRTSIGVAIGSDVQAYDAELAAIAGLTSAANKIPMFSGSESASLLDFKDEDTLGSDSATAVASQQSIKAYVDASNPDGASAFSIKMALAL